MRRLDIIILLLLLLAPACNRIGWDGGISADRDGKMRVELLLPGMYGGGISAPLQQASSASVTSPSPQTKTADNLGPDWHELPEGAYTVPLEVGSTLWIYYMQLQDDGTYGPPQMRGYVVGTNTGGFNSLYACTYTEDENGMLHLNSDELGAPLYLETGTYKFKMISPAHPITKDMKMMVDNGMYFYSTDGRYSETSAAAVDITINDTGVQYVTLNPIISQVARFTFEIKKGDGVYEVDPLAAGIEISGIQNTDAGVVFNWCSEDIADTLEMKYGDKRAWVTIPGDEIVSDESGTLTCDIGVLPTYAVQNSISMLLNLAVNGVPTQYMSLLNGLTLQHGHSYNIKWEVNENDSRVSVMTWQNQSWSADLVPVSAASLTTRRMEP